MLERVFRFLAPQLEIIVKSIAVLVLVLTALLADVFSATSSPLASPASASTSSARAGGHVYRLLGKF